MIVLAVPLAGCFAPPTPVQTTGQAEISASSAAWGFEYPGGLVHSVRGQYYLNVDLTVTNRGSVPLAVLAAEFSIFWEHETVGIPALAVSLSTSTIANGQSAATTVAFLSTEVRNATRIEFRQAGFTNTVSANVPAPSPPPHEVIFSGVSASWSANDSANNTAASGNVFLWVNFTMTNHWDEAVSLNTFVFEVEDANGTGYGGDDRVGPSQVDPHGSASASLIFEVPLGFVPQTMHYDEILGPWTDVAVPTPT